MKITNKSKSRKSKPPKMWGLIDQDGALVGVATRLWTQYDPALRVVRVEIKEI